MNNQYSLDLQYNYDQTKSDRQYYPARKHTNKKNNPFKSIERPNWLKKAKGKIEICYDNPE